MDSDRTKALLDTLERLSPADQSAVVSFAEFLASRSPGVVAPSGQAVAPASAEPPGEIPAPEPVPAPENERVIAALKRLSRTYPMLNKTRMLGATSDLVTQHVLHGRDAAEVIAELERVFQEEYEALKQGGN